MTLVTAQLIWTLVLTTYNVAAELPDSKYVTRSFGHFVTESLCDEARYRIYETSFWSTGGSGGWILTCDPPDRLREYESADKWNR